MEYLGAVGTGRAEKEEEEEEEEWRECQVPRRSGDRHS